MLALGSPMSYTVQMPGWLSAEAALASRWKRSRARGPGPGLGEELQSDGPAEPRVFGLVHDAHTPAAELAGDLVVGDGLADHRPASAAPAGYSFSNSGSPWRIVRSGSRRVHTGSRNPAFQARERADIASAFLLIVQKTQAAL